MPNPIQPITFVVDHAKRRVIRRVRGTIPWPRVSRELLDFFDRHPETIAYDMITNYLEHSGRIEWDDIENYAKELAAILERASFDARKTKRAIVSDDPMADMLLRASQPLFKYASARVFQTEQAAIAWLDEDTGAS